MKKRYELGGLVFATRRELLGLIALLTLFVITIGLGVSVLVAITIGAFS